jgi:hypothetical protein
VHFIRPLELDTAARSLFVPLSVRRIHRFWKSIRRILTSPVLNAQEFYPGRLIDAWALSTVCNVLCGTMYADVYVEMKQGGVDLQIVFFGLLFWVHDKVESPFRKVVEGIHGQVMRG